MSRWQLVDLGWSEATIDRRIADGLLHVLWPGVYALGHRVVTRDASLMAAALACGRGGRLTARAAGAARGLLPAWSTIDVVTPTQRGVTLPGIRAHRAVLRTAEIDEVRGLPVTSLARTALDLAAFEGYERVGELLDRALLDGHYDHTEMAELLAARRGCRGMAILRRAVADLGDEGVVFRSRPERRGRELLRATDLPRPRINGWFPTRAGFGYELDLWWPAVRLDVEIDGPHHRMPRQRRLDRLRDEDLRNFGVRVVRIADEVVLQRPAVFVEAVREALSADLPSRGEGGSALGAVAG